MERFYYKSFKMKDVRTKQKKGKEASLSTSRKQKPRSLNGYGI
jgi:hypothetical protein